jgi:hypothetical protein
LVKKLYIPLPDPESRMQLLQHTMRDENHCLSQSDLESVVSMAAGYSGSDMAALCKEASMEPIRCLSANMDIAHIEAGAVRPIERRDFECAFKSIRPSVNQKDLAQYIAFVFPTSATARRARAPKLRSSVNCASCSLVVSLPLCIGLLCVGSWNTQFGSFPIDESQLGLAASGASPPPPPAADASSDRKE